jgi:subtilase family serine protease
MPKRLSPLAFALPILIAAVVQPWIVTGQEPLIVRPLFDIQATSQTGFSGYTPAEIRHAYGFDKIANEGSGQVIAIVNPFDHPNIEQDLAVFSETLGLPPCTTGNGCFRKVYFDEKPVTDPVWAFETAIDVEWAHAIAPQAKILLIETSSAALSDLLDAADMAGRPPNKASTVSMSWGLPEFANEVAYDGHFVRPNVTFVTGSGDAGRGTLYPAASPYVMSVGGTKLVLDALGNYQSERGWSGSGGGLSLYEPEPLFQLTFPIPNNSNQMRGTPDVAYVADPGTGVAIYDSVPLNGAAGWFEAGGTSVGTPQWAALIAIANSIRAAAGKAPLTGSQGVLYDAITHASDYNDTAKGTNGPCKTDCRATPSYDYLTGLGTPRANNLIIRFSNLP